MATQPNNENKNANIASSLTPGTQIISRDDVPGSGDSGNKNDEVKEKKPWWHLSRILPLWDWVKQKLKGNGFAIIAILVLILIVIGVLNFSDITLSKTPISAITSFFASSATGEWALIAFVFALVCMMIHWLFSKERRSGQALRKEISPALDQLYVEPKPRDAKATTPAAEWTMAMLHSHSKQQAGLTSRAGMFMSFAGSWIIFTLVMWVALQWFIVSKGDSLLKDAGVLKAFSMLHDWYFWISVSTFPTLAFIALAVLSFRHEKAVADRIDKDKARIEWDMRLTKVGGSKETPANLDEVDKIIVYRDKAIIDSLYGDKKSINEAEPDTSGLVKTVTELILAIIKAIGRPRH